ncbi:HAD superfamily phosphatase (TIGR01681 family)/FkbH-like protein [Paenibacillus cellulosilyticus]|uniref:HAD superfamily phosphatase (TIGR01681 family)/FkbH-like protein n=1 Tax=Paenibacillus cellulosilyticus TaxID=375489 RepID=A0A2V2YYH8_9BACL|nr:HAD superfamily phosphatase (TIGR01681 family)/FkbH-like protein [Paenibacillus cellulosilyticus]
MKQKKLKLVIWDLDNTIWNGVILEDDSVVLQEGILDIIRELDSRGILQSISSKNDHAAAFAKLEELGIAEYFLYPRINWNSKSSSVKGIVEDINIGMDTVAFIDDQPFEREEVQSVLPEVLCIDAADIAGLLDREEFMPLFITEDSKNRRHMYMSDAKRKSAEEEYEGPQEEFLASLDMKLTISPVTEDDLQRAEELTVRTHQLNSTGVTYSYEELNELRHSPDHTLIIAELEDIYGKYGKIGLVLLECGETEWKIKLLLMSCRVMSRGVGSVLIAYIIKLAKEKGVYLTADFVQTDRNRMMHITYKFAGFKEIEHNGNHIVFGHDLSFNQAFPTYMKVEVQQ